MKTLILCGGSGTRLWPLSRTLEPKQFLPMFEGQSLFQQTVLRNAPVSSEMIIVSNQKMVHFIHAQISQQNTPYRIVAESIGRNTAAAIALGCLFCDPDDVVLVTPADHRIKNEGSYVEAVQRAQILAEEGYLVTFGIQPTKPETGFGYIESAGEDVLAFHEKPSLEKAEEYLQQGNYLWNSGMFCFKASTLLDELERYAPDIHQHCVAIINEYQLCFAQNKLFLPEEALLTIPAQSIDYAVMEHSQRIKVVPCDLGWSDLGSFDSLHEEFMQADEHDNRAIGTSLHSQNATNNLILSHRKHVAVIGTEDLIIADTPDALLVVKKGQSQTVKKITTDLQIEDPEVLAHHHLVHRPWGSYEVLIDQPTYKVKRIIVKAGQKLSLQKHRYRSEHWTVVKGVGWVTNGEQRFFLHENQSTHIAQEAVHRVENKEDSDLVFIEVQYGSSTSEDDIIRLEDIYGRI